jgi:hypothetical protein
MFDTIDLQEELINVRNNTPKGNRLMWKMPSLFGDERALKDELWAMSDDIKALLKLKNNYQTRGASKIRKALSNKNAPALPYEKVLTEKHTTNIFQLCEIQEICERYRLRFLDSKFFKGDIPEEAIHKIRALEDECKVYFNNFYIMAPSSLFELEDAQNDPLLFVRIADDKFYLIHKWGTDLSWTRKIICFPMRNWFSFLGTVMVFSLLLSFFIPSEIIKFDLRPWMLNILLTFHIFMFTAGALIFWGSVLQRNFSTAEWSSKYFNG